MSKNGGRGGVISGETFGLFLLYALAASVAASLTVCCVFLQACLLSFESTEAVVRTAANQENANGQSCRNGKRF
jgi:hypothetical protein